MDTRTSGLIKAIVEDVRAANPEVKRRMAQAHHLIGKHSRDKQLIVCDVAINCMALSAREMQILIRVLRDVSRMTSTQRSKLRPAWDLSREILLSEMVDSQFVWDMLVSLKRRLTD